jgi:hypothetical protein
MEFSLERKPSDASVLDLFDSTVRAKLRPLVVAVAFLMFFVSVAGVFLTLPLGKSGRADFRHLYTAGYMVPSPPGALLTALLVSYHQVIADTSLLALPAGLVLAGSLTEVRRILRGKISPLLACLVLVGPTVLLFPDTRFYLLALAVAALFVVWDRETPSPKDVNTPGDCQQTDTN